MGDNGTAAAATSAAIKLTNNSAEQQRLLDKKGAGYAGAAGIFLVLAVILITLGVYFYVKTPTKKWLIGIWVFGIVCFIIFAVLAYMQSKIVRCMEDPSQEGCLASIGACG